jgi:hypothetical protein
MSVTVYGLRTGRVVRRLQIESINVTTYSVDQLGWRWLDSDSRARV